MAVVATSVGGVEEIQKRLHVIAGEYARGMERGQAKGGLFILKKAIAFTPIDTGALRASGFVEKHGTGFSTKVTVGFTQPYAVYVHERLDVHHAAPTKAKFLESASMQHRDEVLKIIRDEAQKRKGTMPLLPGRVLGGFPRDTRLRNKKFADTLRKQLLGKQARQQRKFGGFKRGGK